MRSRNFHLPTNDVIASESGSRKKELFTPKFDGNCITLVSSGTVDVQDRINAYAPFCDISYMLSRLKVGDTSVCNSSEPIFGDFTSIPRNPIDAINLIHDAERAFASLPEETRVSCNNDWRVFFAKSIDGTLHNSSGSDNHSPASDKPDTPVNTDVKEEKV